MDNPLNTQQTILSIGPGQLGIERGIESAGTPIKVAAYVEIEAFIIFNLIALMEQGVLDSAPVWADCKTFPYRPFRHKIHGITAGYPCQPFSIAGLRKGANDPRHLWPHIYRIFQSVRPFWGFFENVAEHLNTGYEEVSRDLRKAGYLVEEDLFTAAEVGAPHQRKRLFILAVDNTRFDRYKSQYQISTRRHSAELASKGELDNAYKSRLLPSKGEKLQGFRISENTNTNVPNSLRFDGEQIREHTEPRQFRSNGARWPLGLGPWQHEWEAPRTIKPGLGCAAHGYDFREDLLRMFGNGVVEQTVTLAWQTLWNKHLNHKSKISNLTSK